jgi:small subunit ribosomal protein S1
VVAGLGEGVEPGDGDLGVVLFVLDGLVEDEGEFAPKPNSLRSTSERPSRSACPTSAASPDAPSQVIDNFGVFVQLAPDVVGFLHLSELTDEPVETPDQLVDEGELITVKVAEVDLQRHRVRLGAAGGADRT